MQILLLFFGAFLAAEAAQKSYDKYQVKKNIETFNKPLNSKNNTV